MTASANDRYQRIDTVFDAALDLPTADQVAFIERTCADDAVVRDEVLQLLRAHHRTGGILDTPRARLAPLVFDASDAFADRVPETIGPFRVVRAIGEGGMGQVFLGERADGQFEQRVALKVISHPTPGLVRRFLEERRILALLEHPNIARLVDGGITDDGRPYFAMEFVDGEHIDRYCAGHNLSLDERLALFETVCETVSYAHRHLVIHRDLKPANILVAPGGQVKLLDFGIAKLLDRPGGWTRTDETMTGIRVMTPDVAAPEQVRGNRISTATDVYALGVLLYSLLAGERPYDVRGKSLTETERIICDVEPPPPSSKAPAALHRRIRGDLDLIVMTALQKREERRYQSPTALAEDVRRFREGRAIVARPDSVRYRLGKFVVRHRAAVVGIGLVMAAVAAGAGRERILRQRAEIEARKATEVEGFLVRVFDVADPFAFAEGDRGTISARDLLDRGARRIDSTLDTQPEVQAELRAVLGRVYTNLGLLENATPLLRQSLEQRTRLLGPNDTSVATNMDLLGMALAKQNKYEEAERLLRSALDQRRRLLGDTHRATAESMAHLGTLLEERNQYAPAESLHRQSLAVNRVVFGDSAVETAVSLNDLALIRFERGDYDEADSLYQRALAIYLRRVGEAHPLTAATMQNLASNYQLRGKRAEAEQYFRRSLAAKRIALGNAHPSVTISLNNFGAFLAADVNRLAEAEAMTREALKLDRQMFGERHSYVAESMRNLATILRSKGQFVQAESVYRQALDINRSLFGERHDRIALLYSQLGFTRYQQGDVADAIRLTRQSASMYRELFGEEHSSTLILVGNLARLLTEGGSAAEGESIVRASLTHLDSAKSSQRAQYVAAQRILGAAILAQHRADEALPILERAAELARRQYGETDWRTAFAQLSLGNALLAKGRYADAAPVLRASKATLDKHRVDQPRLAIQIDAAIAVLNAHSS